MLRKKASLIILLMALVFFCIYTFSYPRTSSVDSLYGFENPEDNLCLLFSKQYAETGSFKIPVPYQGQLPRDIQLAFTPRNCVQYDGYIVPKFFIGSLLCWGVIASIDENILLILTPLTAVFVVLALYITARKFFGEIVALITSTIAFVFPVSLWWGSEILTAGFVPVFFLPLGLYYLVKLSESQEKKYYFLTSLFFASAILCRYEWIILILPLLIYVMFIKRGIGWNKRSLMVVAMAVFSFVPILLINKNLYGGYFTTGYQVEADIITEATGVSGLGYFFGFEPGFISRYIRMYIIEFVPLLTIGFIVGLFAIIKTKNKGRYLAIYTLWVIVISAVYYGSDVTWGFDTYWVNADFTRHLLPGYLLAMPFLAVMIMKLKRMNKAIGISLLSIFAATCVVTAFAGPNGIADRNNGVLANRGFHDVAIEKTESNSIIIIRNYDKILFPDRDILNATYLAFPNSSKIIPKEKRAWDIPPDMQILAKKAEYIANQGIPIYVTELSSSALKTFNQALLQDGYTTEALGISSLTEVYKIVKVRRTSNPHIMKRGEHDT
jgi:hypothetical protein